MSRIQNILNKAERDGTVRRMRSVADPVGGGGVATVENPPTPAAPPPPVMTVVPSSAPVAAAPIVVPAAVAPMAADQFGASTASARPQPVSARSVGAVHLSPTLVAEIGYAGTHGVHIHQIVNLNAAPPNGGNAGRLLARHDGCSQPIRSGDPGVLVFGRSRVANSPKRNAGDRRGR